MVHFRGTNPTHFYAGMTDDGAAETDVRRL